MLNAMVKGGRNVSWNVHRGILFGVLFHLGFILGGGSALILLWKVDIASSIKAQFPKHEIAKPSEHI